MEYPGGFAIGLGFLLIALDLLILGERKTWKIGLAITLLVLAAFGCMVGIGGFNDWIHR